MNHATLRQQLLARVSDILGRNAKVEGDRRRTRTPLGGDWKDDALVRENDDVLEVLDAEGRAQLVQLRSALQRLDDGVYGRCERCDEVIAPARLAALPETTTCIECAKVAEPPMRH